MTARHTSLLSIGLVTMLGCGDTKAEKPKHSVTSGANQTAAGQNFLEMDPSTMTDAELQLFIGQLSSRDQAEAKELGLLQAMNRDLCDRLQRLRTECSASIRLIPDGSEKILACDGDFGNNTSIANKMQVKLAATGSFVLVGNKTFGTKPFGTGTSAVQFASAGDTTAKAPRFMDLSSLRLASADGAEMPPIAGMGFELAVNENVVFRNTDLVAADETAGKYYRINPANLLELQKSAACTVDITEIQQIRDKVMATVATQPQGVPVSAGPVAAGTAATPVATGTAAAPVAAQTTTPTK